jgi:hypothetical protein
MTLLAARGETLCQATIRKPLKCAVNPSEAQGFFHDINIWKYARRGVLLLLMTIQHSFSLE